VSVIAIVRDGLEPSSYEPTATHDCGAEQETELSSQLVAPPGMGIWLAPPHTPPLSVAAIICIFSGLSA
jgi:hypothetical protein